MKALLLALAALTLPATGPISLSQIQTEFGRGGANPISLSEYYRDGATGYVKSTDSGVAGVATSGAINMGMFRGAAAVVYFAAVTGDPSCSCTSALSSCLCFTPTVTCSASGGSGNYSYAWAFVSGTSATVGAPSSAATNFSRSGPTSILGTVRSGTYKCTAHDNVTGLDAAVNVSVVTTHYST